MGKDAALRRERLAFDRGSVRRYDADGRLHVDWANISKANICPYYGREIPDSERLGLDPDRIYKLLRDPDELEKSVPTWNNLPLLSQHAPTSADEPQKDLTVGSTGTDAEFKAPFLRNSLVIWDAEAIAGVEMDEQKELSCGYRYVADMTPGEYNGEKYDGVMREIKGNHVALVTEGRAGPDVVVGDGKLKGNPMIKTKALRSRHALLVQGAVAALLAPKLAADTSIDLSGALEGVTRKTFKAKKASIAEGVKKAVTGKLANDEGIGEVVENVVELLDNLADVTSGGTDEDDLAGADEEQTGETKDKPQGLDAEAAGEKLKAAGLDEETCKKAMDALFGAKDADPDPEKKDPPEGAKDEEKVDKSAMDAAISKAKDDARRETIRQMNAISEAKRVVQPHVGELAGAFDSAEAVYKFALDAAIERGADIDLTGVPASAYGAMVRMLPPPTDETKKPTRHALDSKDKAKATELFPGLARIKKA